MREHLLKWAMLELMDALADDIIKIEAVANELVNAATDLSGHVDAGALRDAARQRRVKVLELRGQLAALRQRYGEQFPLDL